MNKMILKTDNQSKLLSECLEPGPNLQSSLQKKNTSIPRLELVAAVLVASLAENIQNSLTNFKITAVHGWSNSMVALRWIKGNSIYKQFVKNRVNHINSKPPIN